VLQIRSVTGLILDASQVAATAEEIAKSDAFAESLKQDEPAKPCQAASHE
jgi:hypothetical protein